MKEVNGERSSAARQRMIRRLAQPGRHCGQPIPLKANLRFVWEGEEEVGSTHLQDVLQKYHDELEGDAWLICDGPIDQSGRQTVVFGARGMTHLRITLFGPNRELHSGHYGNWAPNPADNARATPGRNEG